MADRTVAELNDVQLRAVASVTQDADNQIAAVRGIFVDHDLGLDSTPRMYAETLTQDELVSAVKESGKAYRNLTAALAARFPKVEGEEEEIEESESE